MQHFLQYTVLKNNAKSYASVEIQTGAAGEKRESFLWAMSQLRPHMVIRRN